MIEAKEVVMRILTDEEKASNKEKTALGLRRIKADAVLNEAYIEGELERKQQCWKQGIPYKRSNRYTDKALESSYGLWRDFGSEPLPSMQKEMEDWMKRNKEKVR